VRLDQAGRLADIHGPDRKTGQDLLASAESFYQGHYSLPDNYAFHDFGNPDVYHVPQVASYVARPYQPEFGM
jgi:hypothetical protein